MPMKRVLPRRIALAATALAVTSVISPSDATAAQAADTVHLLVLRENGAGSQATAQRYIDQIMEQVARLNGWPSAKGVYQTSRTTGEKWIAEHDPQYGILSLTTFLALRSKHGLEVLGKAQVKGGGGGQYYVVSKTHGSLDACKGKTLATNHAGDPKFIDRVVADGFSLKDFELVKTPRPLQTIKKVLRDEAACALVDDAQLADFGNIDGASALKPVWSSAKLPPMVVVAFKSAPKAEAKTFKQNLSKVCAGQGASACGSAGIESLAPATEKDYTAVIKAYGR